MDVETACCLACTHSSSSIEWWYVYLVHGLDPYAGSYFGQQLVVLGAGPLASVDGEAPGLDGRVLGAGELVVESLEAPHHDPSTLDALLQGHPHRRILIEALADDSSAGPHYDDGVHAGPHYDGMRLT